jgi:carbonic anhydrase
MGDDDLGSTLNTWLEPIRELRRQHKDELDRLATMDERANRLAELNVRQSLGVVESIPVVAKAIKERGLTVHGLIYDIPEGELRLLDDSDLAPETHMHNR